MFKATSREFGLRVAQDPSGSLRILLRGKCSYAGSSQVEQPGGARSREEQPRRAQESPGELRSTSGRAKGDPQIFLQTSFPKPEGTLNPQNRLADAKERPYQQFPGIFRWKGFLNY